MTVLHGCHRRPVPGQQFIQFVDFVIVDAVEDDSSAKSPTGEALKYIAKYWEGLCRFLDDGRIELDSNAVERTIRPIALNVTARLVPPA